jgi:hypothetical protein
VIRPAASPIRQSVVARCCRSKAARARPGLPGEIVRILHAGIATEAAHRRHHMRSVADEKHAALLEALRRFGDRVPRRGVFDHDLAVGQADRRAHKSGSALLVDAALHVKRIGQRHIAARHHREEARIAGAHQAEKSAQLRIEHVDHAEIAPAQRGAAIGVEVDGDAGGQVTVAARTDAEPMADRAACRPRRSYIWRAPCRSRRYRRSRRGR